MGLRWLVANVVTASSSLPRAQECPGDGNLGKLIATFQRGLPDVTSGRLASDCNSGMKQVTAISEDGDVRTSWQMTISISQET